MRALLFAIAGLTLTVLAAGCAVQQANVAQAAPPMPPAQALPFKGRLVEGDPGEIPPSVAMSLTETSPVRFSYREELTHDERHTSLWLTALAPSTYFGTPLGEYDVTAFATLTISNGDIVIGSYAAKAIVSRSYNLYAEPTHAELEHQAREEVRGKIDAQIAGDDERLKHALAESNRAAGAQSKQ